MSKYSVHPVVIGFAVITAFLTALANVLVENWFGISIFSFGFWVILPVGAVLIGACGASGGLLACRYFNVKPSVIDAVLLMAVGALTMWLIYFLGYATIVLDDGRKVSDIISFEEYFDFVVTKAHMRIGRTMSDTGEVGSFGYVTLLIRFVGVLIGGFAVFGMLKSYPMCGKCNVYFKKIATKVSKPMTTEQAQEIYSHMKAGTEESYKHAIASLPSTPTATEPGAATVTFTLLRCPKCKDELITEEFQIMNKSKNWVAVKDLSGRTAVPSGSSFESSFKA